jgi:ribosome-associated toxin RatA of RatAB toxin-antitoxin module
VTIIDERFIRTAPDRCFLIAADVERWPDILPHYRWVRFHHKAAFGTGRVEMAAWRDFLGPLRYPTWWVSDMRVADNEPAIHFTHVAGITRRMEVKWSFLPRDGGTLVRITHAWDGPRWPLIGRLAWRLVIGPLFVSFIAGRTLAGVAREIERREPQTAASDSATASRAAAASHPSTSSRSSTSSQPADQGAPHV